VGEAAQGGIDNHLGAVFKRKGDICRRKGGKLTLINRKKGLHPREMVQNPRRELSKNPKEESRGERRGGLVLRRIRDLQNVRKTDIWKFSGSPVAGELADSRCRAQNG